jgi:hypothetical protein
MLNFITDIFKRPKMIGTFSNAIPEYRLHTTKNGIYMIGKTKLPKHVKIKTKYTGHEYEYTIEPTFMKVDFNKVGNKDYIRFNELISNSAREQIEAQYITTRNLITKILGIKPDTDFSIDIEFIVANALKSNKTKLVSFDASNITDITAEQYLKIASIRAYNNVFITGVFYTSAETAIKAIKEFNKNALATPKSLYKEVKDMINKEI